MYPSFGHLLIFLFNKYHAVFNEAQQPATIQPNNYQYSGKLTSFSRANFIFIIIQFTYGYAAHRKQLEKKTYMKIT